LNKTIYFWVLKFQI